MCCLRFSSNCLLTLTLRSIIFVHGLTGNRETTWTHKETVTFWPETLLAKELENARILTFGYDADIVGAIDTAGSNTLRDHGKSLANDVALRRMRSRSVDEFRLFEDATVLYFTDMKFRKIALLSSSHIALVVL